MGYGYIDVLIWRFTLVQLPVTHLTDELRLFFIAQYEYLSVETHHKVVCEIWLTASTKGLPSSSQQHA